MQASVKDLRYKMHDILKALDQNEKVTILYHGKIKGTIVPATHKITGKITEHPFFNMLKDQTDTVDTMMEKLRGNRYDAV